MLLRAGFPRCLAKRSATAGGDEKSVSLEDGLLWEACRAEEAIIKVNLDGSV